MEEKKVEEESEKAKKDNDEFIPEEMEIELDNTQTRAKSNAIYIKKKSSEKRKTEKKEIEENKEPSQIEEKDEIESDEEQDYMNYNIDENYQIKNILIPRFTVKELNHPQLTKICDLKAYTEEAISKTVKNKNSSSVVKSLVSKKKNRFCYDGFDLDLTYITTKIIAMGYPSSSIEGFYRNPIEEVQKFLNERHPKHYKVYNLCKEREYPKDTFFKQGYFPFKDHEAPPLNLMRPFCEDAKKFLEEDENNVIAIHCKAGKGRTGTFICCLLLYMNIFKTSDECLQYYGMMRAEDGKGVTIPSQIRYVNYFEHILKQKMPHPIVFVKKKITKIRMYTIPMFYSVYTPVFAIKNNGNIYNNNKKKTIIEGEGYDIVFDLYVENGFIVEGDVHICFYRIQIIGIREKIFDLWFNSNFVPDNNIYEFKKRFIDKACKDKECKYYRPDFKIEIYLEDA
jgi:phosphatidylinositol-3,4,5-trisphosphate 3-phosphatase/dual-specificity protein phosphatase PTEN